MSVLLLPILAVAQAAEPIELKSRIVEASIFKSGLVMLTREIEVPSGEGFYKLDVLPEAIDGTFWYRSADALTIGDVQTRLRISERKEKVRAGSMADLLLSNVGKIISLTLRVPGQTNTELVTGELLQAQAGVPMLLKLATGEYRSFGLNEVVQIKGDNLVSEVEQTIKVPDISIRFKAKTAAPAKLQILTLETGAAWVGSYLVDLGKDNLAMVEGKAQVAVGGLKLEGTRTFAIAGTPNLQAANKYDLAVGYGSLTAYLQGNQSQYRQFRQGPVDPYTLLPTLNQQNRTFNPYNYGGGFGGGGMGGGMGGAGFVQNEVQEETDLSNIRQNAELSRVESLFTYPLGALSMEPGDRITRILFAQNTNYQRLLTWDANPGPHVVNDILRLANTSKLPWTGGKVYVIRENTPVAQIEMPFTPVGQNADLRLGQAHDVVVQRDDRQIRNDDYSSPNWPRLNLRKTINEIKLTITNTRDVPVRLEAFARISGEPISAEFAAVTKLNEQVDAFNWRRAVKWSLDLQPGERREVIFTYSTIFSMGVRSGG